MLKKLILSYHGPRIGAIVYPALIMWFNIGVGGRRAWEQDVFIPRKYGIHQPVGDTAMPGGISRAMRMVPAMLAITKDVIRYCPNAYFFNYSNPMAIICRAIRKKLNYPITGLCIGTAALEWYIADYMGYDRNKVTSLAAGINHCTFIYDFRYEGKNGMAGCPEKTARRIWRLFMNINDKDLSDKKIDKNILALGEPFSWSFFLKYGAFPAPGDRHITEFFTEYFPNGKYFGRVLGHDAFLLRKQ